MTLIDVMIDLKFLVANMQSDGKSEQEIRKSISDYLEESKKKFNPTGDKDIV